jgi:ABC-type sugar transport system permease subunit
MYETTRSKITGILYLAPLILFVAVFTAFPLSQMVWMS